MKSYKEFVLEVYSIDKIPKYGAGKLPGPSYNVLKKEPFSKFQQTLRDGTNKTFHVYDEKAEWMDRFHTLYFVDPETKKTHLKIEGQKFKHKGQKSFGFKIHGLYGMKGGQVRAVDAYKHLMKKHNVHLVSDEEQSPDGRKVWSKLKGDKEVSLYRMSPTYGSTVRKDKTVFSGAGDKWSINGRGDKGAASYFLMGIKNRKSLSYSGDESRLVAYMEKLRGGKSK